MNAPRQARRAGQSLGKDQIAVNLALEVLPSLRLQFPYPLPFTELYAACRRLYFTDPSYRHSINFFRKLRNFVRGDSEEKFKVFTTVQCQQQRIKRAAPANFHHR